MFSKNKKKNIRRLERAMFICGVNNGNNDGEDGQEIKFNIRFH